MVGKVLTEMVNGKVQNMLGLHQQYGLDIIFDHVGELGVVN